MAEVSVCRPITLQIPIINDAEGQVYDFLPALEVAGEPGNSIATIGGIPPHGSTTGWVSFITPIWTPQVIHRQASDLEFAPVNDSDYEPEIHLWEADTPAGAAAAGLTAATK